MPNWHPSWLVCPTFTIAVQRGNVGVQRDHKVEELLRCTPLPVVGSCISKLHAFKGVCVV